MYASVQEFLTDWDQEHTSTQKIMDSLSDSSLAQHVSPEGRSLGFLAWHIVITLGEMGGKAGLSIEAPEEHAPVPSSAAIIATAYRTAAASIAQNVGRQWNDSMLKEEVSMYGEPWKREKLLASLIKHEAHHRGQMTVLMRQAGLRVPGVYGPSKEEWGQFGMQAPQ
jgi:uncharacterized damage-inducible protein DinB